MVDALSRLITVASVGWLALAATVIVLVAFKLDVTRQWKAALYLVTIVLVGYGMSLSFVGDQREQQRKFDARMASCVQTMADLNELIEAKLKHIDDIGTATVIAEQMQSSIGRSTCAPAPSAAPTTPASPPPSTSP
jgi:hypothetical protein